MYQLVFYVPESHLETVKNALFAAGAGEFGDFDQCVWQILGQGQFRPNANSQPYLGQPGQLETVPEYKVEMICTDERIKATVNALLAAHPYQQPAYAIYKMFDIADLGWLTTNLCSTRLQFAVIWNPISENNRQVLEA